MTTNYYDVCVNAARMINKPKASRKELLTICQRMFSYTGRQFEKQLFDAAFYQFRRAVGGKLFQPIRYN